MTEIASIVMAIDQGLESMARAVIERYLDLERPANREFRSSPDDRSQHQTHWHQWGIITHTRMFLKLFREDVPRRLREWGLLDAIDSRLWTPIDGFSRWELLQVTILLHDIGKFAARTESDTGFHFWRHEERSGEVIRDLLDLGRFGLTPAQINYVAITAADHFVLGLVRKRAREAGGFTAAFTSSVNFRTLSTQIRAEHPDDFVEVGILFLGDSLAKADPRTGPAQAVGQYEVNIAVARAYLEYVLEEPSV